MHHFAQTFKRCQNASGLRLAGHMIQHGIDEASVPCRRERTPAATSTYSLDHHTLWRCAIDPRSSAPAARNNARNRRINPCNRPFGHQRPVGHLVNRGLIIHRRLQHGCANRLMIPIQHLFTVFIGGPESDAPGIRCAHVPMVCEPNAPSGTAPARHIAAPPISSCVSGCRKGRAPFHSCYLCFRRPHRPPSAYQSPQRFTKPMPLLWFAPIYGLSAIRCKAAAAAPPPLFCPSGSART